MRSKKLIRNTLTLSAFALSLGLGMAANAETTGQYIDDATITTKVKAALIGSDQMKGSSVDVETDKATVNLTGMVNSKAQEIEAVRLANQVNGVRTVMDHIAVRGAQSQ